MKILVIGIGGMLGSTLFRTLLQDEDTIAVGTARNASVRRYFDARFHADMLLDVDVLEPGELERLLERVEPEVVVNCVGLVKQLKAANDPLVALPVNAMLPHRLAALCRDNGARLIHISTDCVFDGSKGNYTETDKSDAVDLYGMSKFIGELRDLPEAVTLRTSIIGHELNSSHGLIEWFLSQSGSVKGFRRAVFSGLPTIELSRVILEYVVPRSDLSGLYHVSAEPISKFDLLSLVAEIYGIETEIIPDDDTVIDRSLNSERFQSATGYRAPAWPELIESMKRSRITTGN